jgi:hypothetical protein
MPIPTPPPDNSGGYILIKAQGGGQTHRMRFHVSPFTNDNLGTYNAIPTGAETNVQATAANLMSLMKAFFNNTWVLSLDAVFRNVGGVISQYFGVTAPAPVACTNVAAAGLAEEFLCWNFRSASGGRFRFFMFGTANWAYTAPLTIAPANTNNPTILVSYLTGGTPTGITTTTQVRAHDGAVLVAPAHQTLGVNRRIRRRVGDA